MRSLLIIIFFSFSFSEEIVKDIILYDSFGDFKTNYPIKIVNYYLKHNDKILIIKSEHYFKSGELKKIDNYKNGKLDGKIVEFDENKLIKSEINYIEGIQHGLYFEYENGKMTKEGNLSEGKKDGVWIDYYKNGQIKYKRIYKNDKVIEKLILPDSKRANL